MNWHTRVDATWEVSLGFYQLEPLEIGPTLLQPGAPDDKRRFLALRLALSMQGSQVPKERKGSAPWHLASQLPGKGRPLCDPVSLLSVCLGRSQPSSTLGTLEERKRMVEGSAPALPIVRGCGPLQPSTILEVKQMPPWAIMLMVPESQETRIQIWPLTSDPKSLGPSWLLIPRL